MAIYIYIYITFLLLEKLIECGERKCICATVASTFHRTVSISEYRTSKAEINTNAPRRTSPWHSRRFNGNRSNEISHLSSGLEFRRKKLIPGAV